jgi:large subunit ribosomal protein L6
MHKTLNYTVPVPGGVDVTIKDNVITVKGPKGEIKRRLGAPNVRISAEKDKVTITAAEATRREKMHMGTIRGHIRNMVAGVQQPYVFKLKICSSHFPMNVAITGAQLVVKNFLGEKVPRAISFDKEVSVKIAGDVIEVSSPDIEAAGKVASKFEGLTFINNRDRRVFQDGIYITDKPGVA